jgi:hypothetical protein
LILRLFFPSHSTAGFLLSGMRLSGLRQATDRIGEPCRELERLADQSQRGETEMPDTARATTPSQEEYEYSPARPAHGIPDIGRKGGEFHGRSNWYRIFGLIHMLGSAEDDGPVSKIHY